MLPPEVAVPISRASIWLDVLHSTLSSDLLIPVKLTNTSYDLSCSNKRASLETNQSKRC
jgi:hypothetical protein